MRSSFARLDVKYKLLGNFEKILKFYDENALEKLIIIFFFEIFLQKIDHSEISPFFYSIISVSGGVEFPPFPLATPLI